MPQNKTHYQHLKDAWIDKHRSRQEQLWNKHKGAFSWLSNNLSPRQIVAGSLGGLMLLSQPARVLLPTPHLLLEASHRVAPELDKHTVLTLDLLGKLPKEVRPLTLDEEKEIGEMLSNDFGFSVSAELNEIRLNRSYGLIGAEQHLARYPGDSMHSHFKTHEEAEKYAKSGMAPGLGAWGYFVSSKEELTEKDIEREKYYIAVQTFLAPGFMENVSKYRDFFKYRKMLVINPTNGRAMVVVIGDAGPGVSTGKHLGGSPEVMSYLERKDGAQKGPVLYFFIDDPNDTIPLGPITLRNT